MDFIWILFAFVCGLASKAVSLPPSIGFLAAGFLLNFLGFRPDASLQVLSDLGITLMLFMIGLKLNLRDLVKPEVWVGSLGHTALWIGFTVIVVKLLAITSLVFLTGMDTPTALLIAFALSFSSTVCVVKLMEDSGEMKTRHGKLSIGVLVMQDIVAVIFLVAATGKTPHIYAFALLMLLVIKPLIYRLVDQVGHGELLPLTGFFLALGAFEMFELVKVKGDLGALLIGMLLAGHGKATEIVKSLMSFKDLFLIGFFLSIGFAALPTLDMVMIAGLLTLLLPVKFVLFFLMFSLLKLRSRTSFLSALALTNFSEFGLIVAALSVKSQWLNTEWLVILSLAVSLSFVLTNVSYRFAHTLFRQYKEPLKRFESKERLASDIFTQPCNAPVVVIGMGRVGLGAYRALASRHPEQVWGLDADKTKVMQLQAQGKRVYVGDGEDADFWENIDLSQLKMVLLALPTVQDSKNIARQLVAANYQGKIAAIARYDDESEALQAAGIDKVFNFYTEAGVGFADESMAMINS